VNGQKVDSHIPSSGPAEEDIRRQAEAALRRGDYRLAEGLLANGEVSFGELVQDLRIYQAELEIQNAELREAREAAQGALESFSVLFSAAPLAQLVVDRTGMILDANDKAQETFGLENRHLRQHYLRRMVADADHPTLATAIVRAHDEGRGVARQVALHGREGRTFLADLHLALLPEGREQRRFACTVVDLSEIREAKAALAAREQVLAAVLDQTADGVVLIDPETLRFVEFNDAACAGLGYEREDFARLRLTDIQGPMTNEQVVARIAEIREGKQGSFENCHRTRDGRLLHVQVRNRLVQLHGREFLAAIWMDVTEQQRVLAELDRYRQHLEDVVAERTSALEAANRSLESAKEAAEAASRAKSTFLANMSHEIRTPLNAIVGLTHLVRQFTQDAQQVDRLDKVLGAAKHLLQVINDVLDLSRIEAGKLMLESAAFSPRQVVDDIMTLMAEPAREKGLRLVVDVDRQVPGALHGDSLRLGQILLNFVSNAVKFTPAGQVLLAVRLLARDDAGCRLRFEVRDTGVGIPGDHQDRIFQAFEQADSSVTRSHGGSGLGLAISGRLSNLMGGTLGVDSQIGKGSCFWLEITLPEGPAGDVPTVPISCALPSASRQERGRGARILVVEDNPINQEILVSLLEDIGATVTVAGDGAEGVRLAQSNRFDLIVMDMQMPVMDGLTATREIRRTPALAQVPILAMTANAFQEDRQKCLEAGMNDHLAKPFTPEGFYEALTRWLPASGSVVADSGDGNARAVAKLRALPAFDVDAGLAALGGRVPTYLKLLRMLATEHGADDRKIREALDAGAHHDALLVSHSLKGAAGALGATPLHAAAAAVEAALREQADAGVVRERLQVLSEILAETAANILTVV
jgi:PAS domain S-box-containing protein